MTSICRENMTVPNEGIVNTMRQFAGFASIMRICGALTIVAAMSAFLMQGWQEGDDISRYYMLLMQTGLLAACGFALSFIFKENKGARVFFGLGLISITVNMTTFGALIFSTMQWGSALVEYPAFAQWKALGMDQLLLAFAATIVCCGPITAFSHKVFARQSATLLSGIFLAMNLLLLLPVRESWAVGLVAMAAIMMPLWLLHKHIREDIALRTPEGLFAIASLLAPGGIIIFRSLWLYPLDELLSLILSGTAYVALRFAIVQMDETVMIRRIMNGLSVAVAFTVALSCASIAADLLPDELVVMAFTVPLGALMLDVASRSNTPQNMIQFAIIMLTIVHLIALRIEPSLLAGCVAMVAGTGIILLANYYGIGCGLYLGSATAVTGVAVQLIYFLDTIDFSNWITLSITGAGIIVSASLVERHGVYLRLKLNQFRHQA